MSSSGAKRKARVIKVADDEDGTEGAAPAPGHGGVKDRTYSHSILRALLMLKKANLVVGQILRNLYSVLKLVENLYGSLA